MKRRGAEAQRTDEVFVDQSLSRKVIGAAIEVHRTLGPGFAESVYDRALCVELELRQIPFRRQVPVVAEYKGHCVGRSQLDLLVDERLVVELKAVEALMPVHRAQLLSYLRVVRCQVGLLINFNVEALREGVRRIVLSDP